MSIDGNNREKNQFLYGHAGFSDHYALEIGSILVILQF